MGGDDRSTSLIASLPSILQDLLYKAEEEAMKLVDIASSHQTDALKMLRADAPASVMMELRKERVRLMEAVMSFAPTDAAVLQDVLVDVEGDALDEFQSGQDDDDVDGADDSHADSSRRDERGEYSVTASSLTKSVNSLQSDLLRSRTSVAESNDFRDEYVSSTNFARGNKSGGNSTGASSHLDNSTHGDNSRNSFGDISSMGDTLDGPVEQIPASVRARIENALERSSQGSAASLSDNVSEGHLPASHLSDTSCPLPTPATMASAAAPQSTSNSLSVNPYSKYISGGENNEHEAMDASNNNLQSGLEDDNSLSAHSDATPTEILNSLYSLLDQDVGRAAGDNEGTSQATTTTAQDSLDVGPTVVATMGASTNDASLTPPTTISMTPFDMATIPQSASMVSNGSLKSSFASGIESTGQVPEKASTVPAALGALINALTPFYNISEKSTLSSSEGALLTGQSDTSNFLALSAVNASPSEPSSSEVDGNNGSRSLADFEDSTHHESSFTSDVLSSIYGFFDRGNRNERSKDETPSAGLSLNGEINSDLSSVQTNVVSNSSRGKKSNKKKSRSSSAPDLSEDGETPSVPLNRRSSTGEIIGKKSIKIPPPPPKPQVEIKGDDNDGESHTSEISDKRFSTGMKGIDYRKSRGLYDAKIYYKAKIHRLGEYELACDAALAYDEAARVLYNTDAKLNYANKKDYLSMRGMEMRMRGINVDLKVTLAAMAGPIKVMSDEAKQHQKSTPLPPPPRSKADGRPKVQRKNSFVSNGSSHTSSIGSCHSSADHLLNMVREIQQQNMAQSTDDPSADPSADPSVLDPSVGSDSAVMSVDSRDSRMSRGSKRSRGSRGSKGSRRRRRSGKLSPVQEYSQAKHSASDPSTASMTASDPSVEVDLSQGGILLNSKRYPPPNRSRDDTVNLSWGLPSRIHDNDNTVSQLSGGSPYESPLRSGTRRSSQSERQDEDYFADNPNEQLVPHDSDLPRDLDLPSDFGSSFEPSTIRSTSLNEDDGPKFKLSWSNESQSAAMTGRSLYSTTIAQTHNERQGSSAFDERLWSSFAWILTFPIPSGCIRRPTKAAKQAWREKVALFLIMVMASVFCVGVLGFVPLLLCDEDYIFSEKDVWLQHGESWVYAHGIVYDIKDFIYRHPGGIDGITGFLGQDASRLIPRLPPSTLPSSCLDLEKIKQFNLTNSSPENSFMHPACPRITKQDTLLGMQCHTFMAGANGTVRYLGDYERGILSHSSPLLNEKIDFHWFSLYGRVYDATDYVRGINENRAWFDGEQEKDLSANPAAYLTPTLNNVILNSLGTDATRLYEELFGTVEFIGCLETLFYAGILDDEVDMFCYTVNIMMYCMLVFVVSLMIVQFCASMIYICPRHRTYNSEDVSSPVMVKVPCYCEGDNELRKTIKSVFNTSYPDENKILVMVADGLITGEGQDVSTPEHLANLLGFDIDEYEDDTFEYDCIGVVYSKNRARVYHGILQKGHKFLKYIVIIKCGLPQEVETSARPGNRGKRDSQLIMIGFFNRVHYGRELTELDCAIQRAMRDLNLQADMIRFLMAIDADTRVDTMSLTHMAYHMNKMDRVIALCGETKVDNKSNSWVTMIQVFEYYNSHHLKKAFEAAFGCVTCLPGCFTMYRIIDDDGTPMLAGDGVMYEYSRNDIETLHEKNLYHLGEDRLLTTLLLQYFPDRSLTFIPEAVCWTVVPHTFKILLSQRRRWINSTVHNMVELLRVKTLCGVSCVSMKVVVLIDLIATMILPASYIYAMFLVFLVAFDNLPVSTVLLVLYAIMMGCQIAVFVVRAQWEYLWWFSIYFTVGLPIFYFVLPVWAFWNMDDFSWGKTRAVGGVDVDNSGRHHDEDDGGDDDDGEYEDDYEEYPKGFPTSVRGINSAASGYSSVSGEGPHRNVV